MPPRQNGAVCRFLNVTEKTAFDEPLLPMPTDPAELARCLADPEWRLFSGCLYKIMIKGKEDDEAEGDEDSLDDDSEAPAFVIPFKPNRAQRRFIKRLWNRNLILKARQLGFTTLIAIIWLDHALFNSNQRCGIIAQNLKAAGAIFRDKVRFAYRNLPGEIRERFPLSIDSASELMFAHNNSSIHVSTSMRSGTTHRLHISEFGKICAKSPDKAEEVVTGSIPSVPLDGIVVIESTAEGREGDFFNMVEIAEKNYASKKILTKRDYRLHFYGWWDEPNYRMDSTQIPVSQKEHEYFDIVEGIVLRDLKRDIKIDPDQRAWYTETKNSDFSGREERMWQEYPSFPAEAFQTSTDGNYYAKDMIELRKRGGITKVPMIDVPVNTFWDIGSGDGCAVWFHQELRGEDRFIGYMEAHDQDLRFYVKELRDKGYLFGTHYLPHDAAHKRLSDFNKSTMEMLQALMPGEKFIIVPIISELINGINQTRKNLKTAYFDEEGCKLGIQRIEGYKKRFSRTDNRYIDSPNKANGCSEGADALRQWAQAKEIGLVGGIETKYVAAEAPDWRT